MNKAGETRSYSAGDKLPESTGDKLPTGEIDSTLLGRLWTVLGNGSAGVSGIPPGNIEIFWGYQTSLRPTVD